LGYGGHGVRDGLGQGGPPRVLVADREVKIPPFTCRRMNGEYETYEKNI
jgi:hypothetical protein